MKPQSKLALTIFAGTFLVISHGAAMAQTVAVATGAPGKVHLLPATMETTQLGWYDNAQKPVLTIKPGDSVVMETMMHFHDRLVPGDVGDAGQDSAGGSGSWRPYAHRADLRRRRRARRCAQSEDQQDRPALLWREHELSRICRAIPEGVSGRENPLRLSRLGQQGCRVPARRFRSAAAISRSPRRRPRRARTLQHRPAGTLRGQLGPA